MQASLKITTCSNCGMEWLGLSCLAWSCSPLTCCEEKIWQLAPFHDTSSARSLHPANILNTADRVSSLVCKPSTLALETSPGSASVYVSSRFAVKFRHFLPGLLQFRPCQRTWQLNRAKGARLPPLQLMPKFALGVSPAHKFLWAIPHSTINAKSFVQPGFSAYNQGYCLRSFTFALRNKESTTCRQ